MKRALVLVSLCLLLGITIIPAFALTSYTVSNVNSITPLGNGVYSVTVDIDALGWTNDGGGNDHTGTVYYDCLGNLLGWFNEVHFSDYSGPVNWYTFNFGSAPGPYLAVVHDLTAAAGSAVDVLAGPVIGSFAIDYNDTGVCANVPTDILFRDGRINNRDAAAPIVVYPVSVGGDTALHVYNPQGVLLLVVSTAELAAAPANPTSSVIVAQGNGVVLSSIPGTDGGLWQFTASQPNGKIYTLTFASVTGGSYTSSETEPAAS
jgi:hypothetical protein